MLDISFSFRENIMSGITHRYYDTKFFFKDNKQFKTAIRAYLCSNSLQDFIQKLEAAGIEYQII